MRLSGRVITVCACLAALPQLFVFAQQIRTGRFSPGSSYEPRVAAVLGASRSAVQGGPFATVKKPVGFTLAPGLLNDLGMAAISDAWGRLCHRPLTERHLAWFNLGFIAGALGLLVAVVPPPHRLSLVPPFLLVPLAVYEYRAADSVTVHGALAALAVAVALALARPLPWFAGALLGVLVFAAHKLRSPYGLFAMAAMVVVASLLSWMRRDKRALVLLGVAALAFAAAEVPWRVAVARRAADPRVRERDVLPAHNVYNPLISGVGWTANRWGIEPWDPWVVTFLAERTGLPPVSLATFESERRARLVYFDLWREAPGHLLRVYAGRVPEAWRSHGWLGRGGAVLWAVAFAMAVGRTWVRRDGPALALLAAPAVVAAGLVAQIVLIDPRLLYSYPLRFISALGFFLSLGVLVRAWRPAPVGPAPGGSMPGPMPPETLRT